MRYLHIVTSKVLRKLRYILPNETVVIFTLINLNTLMIIINYS